MANDPALEHALLEHLRFAPLTCAELVRRTGAGNQRVQFALDALVREGFVVRRPQDEGPEDYALTQAGTGRLDVILDLTNEPLKTMGKLFAATVADTIRPREPQPANPRALLLSDDDRTACSYALANHFAAGRIDQDELGRRTDLLFAARTRGELDPAFAGLPPPTLAEPVDLPPGSRRWNLGLIGWMLLPVLIVGLFIGGSIASGDADLSTSVLFVVVAVGVLAWRFGGSGRRRS
ncbi:DUF1707 domain-containing protein [Kribbella sp. NBC_00482]|uniref:DUF1707 domain-containing protein n=1 Tax=Kribbella sp. NBC_00482 TaxID=2975968 RepID=UPI002E19B3E3